MSDLDDKIKAIREGLGGVTPGPWRTDAIWIWSDGAPKPPMHLFDTRGWGHLTGNGHGALGLKESDAIAIMDANAAHVARLDPDTVRQILDRLEKAERERDELAALFNVYKQGLSADCRCAGRCVGWGPHLSPAEMAVETQEPDNG